MSFYGKSNNEILREIGYRLKQKRLNENITQKELSERTGLNRSTISEIEGGRSFEFISLIKILRALNVLEQLDTFLPEPGISPIQIAKIKGKRRKRAYSGGNSGK